MSARARLRLAAARPGQNRRGAYWPTSRRRCGGWRPWSRLERDLHDGIQQRLVSLALKVQTIKMRTSRPADEIHIVYTEFMTMMTQRPVVRRLLPLEVEEV